MKFYLDFEAAQYTGRIISIGCACENGAKFKSFISLPKGEKVGKEVSELTGITDEMLRSAPTADVVFAQLFEWVRSICKDIPIYYVYGDADKGFLKNTIKKMTDFTAITFASSIINFMEDYSPNIKKHYGILIGLNKVYNLMKNTNNTQRHDALEDAEMLQYIDEHLAEASTELPEELTQKKKERNDIEEWQKLSGKLLKFIHKWDGKKRNYAQTDGVLVGPGWCVYSDKKPNKKYYFSTMDCLIAWYIKFNEDGKSVKKQSHVKEVKKNIEDAIKNNVKYKGYYIVRKEV